MNKLFSLDLLQQHTVFKVLSYACIFLGVVFLYAGNVSIAAVFGVLSILECLIAHQKLNLHISNQILIQVSKLKDKEVQEVPYV